MMKCCPRCKETDTQKFYKNRTRPDGLQVFCKNCQKSLKADWRTRNPGCTNKKYKSYINRRFRVTREDFAQRLFDQGNVCALCFQPFLDKSDPPCLDHKDDTIRGIIHRRCNLALGFLDDNPEKALLVVTYLKSHLSASLSEIRTV